MTKRMFFFLLTDILYNIFIIISSEIFVFKGYIFKIRIKNKKTDLNQYVFFHISQSFEYFDIRLNLEVGL